MARNHTHLYMHSQLRVCRRLACAFRPLPLLLYGLFAAAAAARTSPAGSAHAAASAVLPADVFLSLDKQYQDVIADICRRMGEGMADFAGEDEDSEVGAFVWCFISLFVHACIFGGCSTHCFC